MSIIAKVLQWLPMVFGFISGNKNINPSMPTGLAGITDKFSGILATVGVVYYLLGNRADVVSLNYLELAGVVLLINMALKIDPPKV